MRKSIDLNTRLQKSCKSCNRQLFDNHLIWGIVAELQILYRNIESYYYYKELRKYGNPIFATLPTIFAETLTGPTYKRLQEGATLVAKPATFNLVHPSNVVWAWFSKVANLNSVHTPSESLDWHVRLINRLIAMNPEATIKDYFRITDGYTPPDRYNDEKAVNTVRE